MARPKNFGSQSNPKATQMAALNREVSYRAHTGSQVVIDHLGDRPFGCVSDDLLLNYTVLEK